MLMTPQSFTTFRHQLATSTAIAALLVGVLVLAGCDLPQAEQQATKSKDSTSAPADSNRAAQEAPAPAQPAGRTALDGMVAGAPLPPPMVMPQPEMRDKFPDAKPNP